MRKLTLMILIGVLSIEANAIDLEQYRSWFRSHVVTLLGEDSAIRIMGVEKEKNKINLPKIPQIKINAKDESFFSERKGLIYSQGKEYNALSKEEKRSFRLAFLRQIYSVTKDTQPQEKDLINSLNVLEQEGKREGIYRSIILSQAYFSLEQRSEKASSALVNFVEYFSPKFLSKKYKKESIQKLNLWSLKRLLTEKSLELLDVLAKEPESLYRWYAVLSSELARDYPSLWKSEIRGKTRDIYHYQWSKKAPFQHIKSEVIIKLHKTMNYLNGEN